MRPYLLTSKRHLMLLALTLLMPLSMMAQPKHVEAAFRTMMKTSFNPPSVNKRVNKGGDAMQQSHETVGYNYRNVSFMPQYINAFLQSIDEDASQLFFYIRQDDGSVPTDVVSRFNEQHGCALGSRGKENIVIAAFHSKWKGQWQHYYYAISWHTKPSTLNEGKHICDVYYSRTTCDSLEKSDTPAGYVSPEGLRPTASIRQFMQTDGLSEQRSRFFYRSCKSQRMSYADIIKFSLPQKASSRSAIAVLTDAFDDSRQASLSSARWDSISGASPCFNLHFMGRPLSQSLLSQGQQLTFTQQLPLTIRRLSLADDRNGTTEANYNLVYTVRPDSDYTGYLVLDNDADEGFNISGAADRMSMEAFYNVFSDVEQWGDTVFDFRSSTGIMVPYRAKIDVARQSMELNRGLFNDELRALNESYASGISQRRSSGEGEMAELKQQYEQRKEALKADFTQHRIDADRYTRELSRATDSYAQSMKSLISQQQNHVTSDENQYSQRLKELRRHYNGKLELISPEGEPHGVISELLSSLIKDYRQASAPGQALLRQALGHKIIRLVKLELSGGLNKYYRQLQRNAIGYGWLSDEPISKAASLLSK